MDGVASTGNRASLRAPPAPQDPAISPSHPTPGSVGLLANERGSLLGLSGVRAPVESRHVQANPGRGCSATTSPRPLPHRRVLRSGLLAGHSLDSLGGSVAPLQFPHSVGSGAPGTGPAKLGSDAASTCNPASPGVLAIGPGPAAGGHGGQQLETGVGAGGDCALVKGRGVLKFVAPECPGAASWE